MATFETSNMNPPYLQDELIPPYASKPFRCLRKQDGHSSLIGNRPEAFNLPFSVFFRERWQRIGIMNHAFEQSESGAGVQSQERSEERLHDEQSWSRMDDEGCPNGR